MTRPRLLLVEDNPVIRTQLIDTLGGVFDVVAAFATAAEAVAWLDTYPTGWDLAVIDIFLRQGHGYEVLRSCAARKPGQAAVVLSNYTREPARSSALRMGASAVFDKSFEMEAFFDYCFARAQARPPAPPRTAARHGPANHTEPLRYTSDSPLRLTRSVQ